GSRGIGPGRLFSIGGITAHNMEQFEAQSEGYMLGEIDRRLFLQYVAAAGLAGPFMAGVRGTALARASEADAGALERVFASPPQGAGPGVYWYWLGGNG